MKVGQRTGRLAESLFKKSELQTPPQPWQKLWGWPPASYVSTSPPNDRGALWRLSNSTGVHTYGCLSMALAILQPCKDRRLVLEKLRVMQMFLGHRNAN